MKKYKGAVFFDYDGTLTDKDFKIFIPTHKTTEAIKHLKKNGYIVCLSTGRNRKYIPQFEIEFDCMSTTNGGCTLCNDKIIGQRVFDKNTLLSLTEYFKNNNMIYVLERPDKCFVNLPKDSLFNRMISLYSVNKNLFTPLNNEIPPDINKILLIYRNREQLKPMLDKFSSKAKITSPDLSVTSCDINPLGVTKANGVYDVCKYFNIVIA